MAPISSPSIRVVCPLEASCFHITLVFDFQIVCDVSKYSLETRFSTSTGEIYTFSNECENILLVSDSARTSFCTTKLKNLKSRTSTILMHQLSFVQKCCIKDTVMVKRLHTCICNENVHHGSFQFQRFLQLSFFNTFS